MIYLGRAATTPVPEEVAHAVYDTLVSGWGNPSSQYPIGKQARDAVAAARETIAAALGCKSEQFVFTSCGSESDNWAVRLALHQNRHVGKHVITTAVEHSAILETCKALEQEGYSVTYLKPDRYSGASATAEAPEGFLFNRSKSSFRRCASSGTIWCLTWPTSGRARLSAN